MSGITMKLTGLEGTLKKLDLTQYTKKANTVLKYWGESVAEKAKQLAPVDEGFLKGQIGSKMVGDLKVEIFCNCDYAAYIEFGTRKFAARYVAALPQNWQTYAATFKGKGAGGTFDQFVQAIMAWVERKGIGSLKTKSGNKSTSKDSLAAMQQAAYWIALNIIQNGIKPHPFMYPAVTDPVLRGRVIQDLKDIME